MHTHSDLTPLMDPRCASKARQGVTTELVGHCGFSAFPLVPGTDQERAELNRAVMMGRGIRPDWSDCAGYLAALERARPAINLGTLVGGGTVRSAVVGYEGRPPRADELKAMCRCVAEAMEQGAFGLSSGLTLYPSSAAQPDELAALCREVAVRGGLYDTHTRHLPDWHFRSVEEAIDIARRTQVAVEIAHLCIIDPRHWGEAETILEIIEQGRADGVDVNFDAYPYLAAGFPPSELLPDWVQNGGSEAMLARLRDPAIRAQLLSEPEGIPRSWERVTVAWSGPYGDPALKGQSLKDLAQEAGVPPEEVLLDIVVQTRDVAMLIMFNRVEEDVEAFICHPLGMIGSDGISVAVDGPWADSPVHPRFYGAFPRVLVRYVRQRAAMAFPEAVRKMTSLPADRLGLSDRGRIREGYVADLVVLDPNSVEDTATFEDPHQYPEGISHTMISGEWVVRDGEQTSARPGRILRHQA